MYHVKENFPSMYENTSMLCELCAGDESTQQHLFMWKEVAKMLIKICEIRRQLLEDLK